MKEHEDFAAGLILELRRGTIVLSVLSQLNTPKYGYSLVHSLEERGIQVEAGTLYPLLRRLEKQGLLRSEWETTGAKPRKYYLMTDQGRAVYRTLRGHWKNITQSMESLLCEEESTDEWV